MPTPEKAQQIDEIATILDQSQLVIVADYRGLTVADLTGFRSQLRQHDAKLRVVKNTLTRIAAERVGTTVMTPLLEGPTALIYTTGDPVATAKAVNDFVRSSRILTVKGALLGRQLLSPQDVEQLATLPSRPELVAKVVGGLQAPLYGLVSVLSGPVRSLLYVLQARARQLEGEAAA
ncbi:50S ribosomal protein L10 [Thermorudis peleae]|uniref:50S ribosomal protein L10 n=1 Tax=Thermorudis peleae TaxID=1382356 RepID=UPI00056ED462|nr:50S ribosomal protein L10 [Thermorudis peleae]MBX6755175.1 50S ribosomal protein L10 [Thermorudis peleae]